MIASATATTTMMTTTAGRQDGSSWICPPARSRRASVRFVLVFLAMCAMVAFNRPLAVPPAAPPIPWMGFKVCSMCDNPKEGEAFYWHVPSGVWRGQCKACDSLWKKIHYQLRKQNVVEFYYERVKPHPRLRIELFNAFYVAKDLGMASSDFNIKAWAQRLQIWPPARAPAPSPANGSPAPGGVVLRQPAPGGEPQPPAPGGEPARSSSSAPKRARLVSTQWVTLNARGGVEAVESQAEITCN